MPHNTLTDLTDRRTLARMQLIRPDLHLDFIFPRNSSDGPYMRAFADRAGNTVLLRTSTGGLS